jgi:chromosome segregation ATPase
MLKKLVIFGIVGVVAVSAVKNMKVGSYIRSEFDAMREHAESKIPPEREIARLRNEIKLLDKDIWTVVTQLAKERVEVDQLREKSKDLSAKQSRDKELLQARAGSIKSATEQVTFGDRTLSLADAKVELEEGVRRFGANQKSLEALDMAISSRDKVKYGLEKQLDAMKNQKTELTASVDALEAELTALKLQQMESKYQTDETRLAKIKEDIRALKTKFAIEREKLALMPAVFEPAPTKAASAKSVDDIMAPLTKPATKNAEPKITE